MEPGLFSSFSGADEAGLKSGYSARGEVAFLLRILEIVETC